MGNKIANKIASKQKLILDLTQQYSHLILNRYCSPKTFSITKRMFTKRH